MIHCSVQKFHCWIQESSMKEARFGNAPVAHPAGMKLIPNASAVSVMTAEKDKGAGVSSVVWGNQADLDAQEANDEVE